jgi:3-oxoacyl-[acyl-carrier-protein] synthase III
MISVALLGTGRVLPGRSVTTREVAALATPPLDAQRLEQRTGIQTRSWVEPGTRAAPIGAQALRQALDAARLIASDLKRIIFVSSSGGDWLSPSTASLIALELQLTGQCECLDLSNGCVGFLTAFDLAARCVATGLGPVAVVTVELFSDIIVPEEPRCFAIFGDAAGAVVLGQGSKDEGVLGVSLRTDPTPGLTAFIEHPRWTGKLQPVRFGLSNLAMSEGAIALLVGAANEALAVSGLDIGDIDWVLPHQPNGFMLDRIIEALGAPNDRTVRIVAETGSIAAASIPFSLDVLVRSGRVRRNHTVLMVSVGGGASYGALVLRVGAPPCDTELGGTELGGTEPGGMENVSL